MLRKLLDILKGRPVLAVVACIGFVAFSSYVFLGATFDSMGSSYVIYDGYRIHVRGNGFELVDIPVKPYGEEAAQGRPQIGAVVALLDARGFKRIAEFPDLGPGSPGDATRAYQGTVYCMTKQLSNSWPVYASITDDGFDKGGYMVWFSFRFNGFRWNLDRSWAEASKLANAIARDIGFKVMGLKEEPVRLRD